MGSAAYSNMMHPELSEQAMAGRFDAVGALAAKERPDRAAESMMPSRLVRAVQTARRRREALFAPTLFADPAWDMLLELYAIRLEQRKISVSSLCYAAYVPLTTALRWVAKLESDGLAVRRQDPSDARRFWIDLSDRGMEAMCRYFETLPLGALSI